MNRILYVSHGRSTANISVGSVAADAKLTEKYAEQAKLIIEKFKVVTKSRNRTALAFAHGQVCHYTL